MKIVSEDSVYSNVAKLFRFVYSDDVFFSEGVGELGNVIRGVLSIYPKDTIIAYIDLVPGNNDTRKKFLQYRREFKNNKNVYIIPIVCSEFCIINMWIDYGIITDDRLIKIYKNFEWFGNYGKDCKEKFIEGFSKKVLLNNTPQECNRGNDILFYSEDICSFCGTCPSLTDRAIDFIKEHEVFLSNELILRNLEVKSITYEESVRVYLEKYNKMCDNYSLLDSSLPYKKFQIG